MKNTDQKKDIVFAVIAKLESSGKKINAELVAKTANMGKQTVLPYYNKWRFLKKMEDYHQGELPQELVSALKQHMGQWKYLSEQQHLNYVEENNKIINDLEENLYKSTTTIEKLQQDIVNKTEENKQQNIKLEQFQTKIQQLEHTITELQINLDATKQQKQQLEQNIEAAAKNHQLNLNNLESKLDKQHQQQLDHWIKISDQEKQNRYKSEKNLTEKQQELNNTHNTILQLSNKIDRLKELLIDEEQKQQQQINKISALEDKLEDFEKIAIILDCDITEVTSKIRKMLTNEVELTHYKSSNGNLVDQINSLQQQLQTALKNIDTTSEKNN